MALAIAAICLTAALALLALGLRGRRTDDHPLCRRCGFDLTGRADTTTRCGECGADLSSPKAIRVGHRVRRRWPLWAGVLLLLPSLAGLGVAAWVRSHDVDVASYDPVWWLRHELNAGPTARAAALAELQTRLGSSDLTDDQVTAVADRALAAQAGPGTWDGAWAAFLDDAHRVGRLSRPRCATYGRQAFDLALRVRPTIRPGDRLPVALDVAGGRCGNTRFAAECEVGALRIDGQLAGTIRSGRALWASTYGGTRYGPELLPGTSTQSLSIGRHTISLVVRLTVCEDNAYRGGASSRQPPMSPMPTPVSLGTYDVPVSNAFSVCDAAHEPPLVTTDPALRLAVTAAIMAKVVAVGDPFGPVVNVEVNDPPAPGARRSCSTTSRCRRSRQRRRGLRASIVTIYNHRMLLDGPWSRPGSSHRRSSQEPDTHA